MKLSKSAFNTSGSNAWRDADAVVSSTTPTACPRRSPKNGASLRIDCRSVRGSLSRVIWRPARSLQARSKRPFSRVAPVVDCRTLVVWTRIDAAMSSARPYSTMAETSSALEEQNAQSAVLFRDFSAGRRALRGVLLSHPDDGDWLEDRSTLFSCSLHVRLRRRGNLGTRRN